MVTGVIYKYTSPDGGIYIGQTLDECHRRGMFFLDEHYAGYKIDDARKKFGPENFEYERLVRKQYINAEIARKELDELEDYYIKKYDSIKHGYNLRRGNHWRKKLINGFNPDKDYVMYNYTVKKPKLEANSKGKKPVLQYDLYGNFIARYKSVGQAARITGIHPSSVSRCCRGELKRARDSIFEFEQ